MPKAEALAANLHQLRLGALDHAYALEERIAPNVVIAGEEVHRNSGVHQGDQASDHSCSFAGDNVVVFIPEIPDISQQVKRKSIVGNR